eukprot:scaffold121427_cov60-Phaeocystis_antarctica.AAC.2
MMPEANLLVLSAWDCTTVPAATYPRSRPLNYTDSPPRSHPRSGQPPTATSLGHRARARALLDR